MGEKTAGARKKIFQNRAPGPNRRLRRDSGRDSLAELVDRAIATAVGQPPRRWMRDASIGRIAHYKSSAAPVRFCRGRIFFSEVPDTRRKRADAEALWK